MKQVGIVTDSHGGISLAEAEKLGVKVVPMPFYFGDDCYYEGVSISREDFFERLNNGENVSTSQPSPEAVMEAWREALISVITNEDITISCDIGLLALSVSR